MAKNKILPWAQTGTSNVLSDDAYAADVAKGGLYGDGVKTGQASSQQANKTWRQATAPGSGLGQFLVDSLDVDVTDADTPATFSARIANSVLKLSQISPFNQSWATATGGYRKYAIVSDSSGNYWSSTSDQNVTVPGASGAKWVSLLGSFITQTQADGRYLQYAANNVGTPLVVTVDGGTFTPSFQIKWASGQKQWIPVASNAALNTEISNRQSAVSAEASTRANADSALQTNINRKQDAATAVTTTGATSGSGDLKIPSLVWSQAAGNRPYVNHYQSNGSVSSPVLLALQSDLPTSGKISDTSNFVNCRWVKINGFLRLSFIAIGTGAGGTGNNYVSFPTPFKSGTTPVLALTIDREPSSNGLGVSRFPSLANPQANNGSPITETGFHFQPTFNTGESNTSGRPFRLHVIAEGDAP